MRAAAARDAEILKPTMGFSTTSTSDFNKTYENTILSHRRTSKKNARAHLVKPLKKNNGFSTFLSKGPSRATFALALNSSNGMRALARGTIPVK